MPLLEVLLGWMWIFRMILSLSVSVGLKLKDSLTVVESMSSN